MSYTWLRNLVSCLVKSIKQNILKYHIELTINRPQLEGKIVYKIIKNNCFSGKIIALNCRTDSKKVVDIKSEIKK